MDKILLEVTSSALSKTYEFWVSKKQKISNVKQKIMQEISSYEKNSSLFGEGDGVFLYLNEQEKTVLAENLTVEEAGIRSGMKLLLI